MNSPPVDDAGFDFVTENVDTLAAERGKGHNIGEEKEVDGVEEAETKSDKLKQKNAAALQQADAVALERPFDAQKVFQQTLLKLAEYQNEQRQNQTEICVQIGELKKLVGPGAGTFCLATELITQAARANVASGEEHRKVLTEHEALRAQMAQVKELHKMQEQREAQMLLRMDKLRGAFNSMFLLLTPQNRWDVAARANVFTLVESERLIAKCRGDKHSDLFHPGGRSVFAEMPIPNKHHGIFYFELEVGAKQREDDRCTLFFGLAPRQMPLDDCVGYHKGSYAYDNWGTFWGHPVERSEYDVSDTRAVVGMPEFDLGDIVGCGVNLATRQIIYTKNGERLDTANLFVDFATDLFPCVSSFTPVDKIEANFGPNFKFNIFDGI
uniref:B30.2/SPRY domain-containing protein n=1 Tax=Globodera rostochiensis TaxID=31243 RepID=A0A914HMN5_GLORO